MTPPSPKDRSAGQDSGAAGNGETAEAPSRLHETLKPLHSAEYIADLSGELAKMARDSKLDLIAYLLDIVRLEADTTVRRLAETATG